MGGVLDERINTVTTPDQVASLLDICANSGIAYSVSKRGVLLLARSGSAVSARRKARSVRPAMTRSSLLRMWTWPCSCKASVRHWRSSP